MTRTQLEHIIRAAATIADDDEIIIGSQAVLGQFPDAPPELLVSNEANVYPKNRPERADLIDGSIGELSPFHDTFGYYAQGVGEGTATLPEGWRGRLVPLKTPATRGATGLCLEIHDLVISKHVAGRDKDIRFVRAAAQHGLIEKARLLALLADTALSDDHREIIRRRIEGDFRAAG